MIIDYSLKIDEKNLSISIYSSQVFKRNHEYIKKAIKYQWVGFLKFAFEKQSSLFIS